MRVWSNGNLIKRWLYNWILPQILKKQCDSRIPRSGKRGEAVDCYVIAIDHRDAPFFVAQKIEDNELVGLKWDGNSYSIDTKLPLASVSHETAGLLRCRLAVRW
jgi:hypothetical protein